MKLNPNQVTISGPPVSIRPQQTFLVQPAAPVVNQQPASVMTVSPAPALQPQAVSTKKGLSLTVSQSTLSFLCYHSKTSNFF